jgi:hypothetical protein
MPRIGDSIPTEFVVQHDKNSAQETLRKIANAQAAARLAEKIARSERKGKKIAVQKFSDREDFSDREVNWEKQDRIKTGKNQMSEMMNAPIPSRGQTLAHSAKAKANKAKRK